MTTDGVKTMAKYLGSRNDATDEIDMGRFSILACLKAANERLRFYNNVYLVCNASLLAFRRVQTLG